MNANKAMAFATLNTFADSRVALIAGMHKAGYTLETARGVVIEWACGKVGSGDKGFKVNEETGKVTLVSSHAKYETAKTVVRDVMHMMAGTTRREASTRKEVDPVAQALKALAKLTPAQLRKVLAAF
jgi:hypothetical protein